MNFYVNEHFFSKLKCSSFLPYIFIMHQERVLESLLPAAQDVATALRENLVRCFVAVVEVSKRHKSTVIGLRVYYHWMLSRVRRERGKWGSTVGPLYLEISPTHARPRTQARTHARTHAREHALAHPSQLTHTCLCRRSAGMGGGRRRL